MLLGVQAIRGLRRTEEAVTDVDDDDDDAGAQSRWSEIELEITFPTKALDARLFSNGRLPQNVPPKTTPTQRRRGFGFAYQL